MQTKGQGRTSLSALGMDLFFSPRLQRGQGGTDLPFVRALSLMLRQRGDRQLPPLPKQQIYFRLHQRKFFSKKKKK